MGRHRNAADAETSGVPAAPRRRSAWRPRCARSRAVRLARRPRRGGAKGRTGPSGAVAQGLRPRRSARLSRWTRSTPARSSVCSSSRPSIIEISFSGGRFAVSAEPTSRPLRRTEMRSAIRYTWSMKWVMKTIAIPRRLRSRMIPNRSSVSFASRLAVGSSSTRTRVSSSSARAMAMSCWMATEYVPSGRSTSMSILRRLSRSRAILRAPRQSNEPEPARLAAERQVLGHRHRRNEVDFLVDRADAEGLRLACRTDLDRAAVQTDLAPVAAQGAGQDLDQRRLARPVLA